MRTTDAKMATDLVIMAKHLNGDSLLAHSEWQSELHDMISGIDPPAGPRQDGQMLHSCCSASCIRYCLYVGTMQSHALRVIRQYMCAGQRGLSLLHV